MTRSLSDFERAHGLLACGLCASEVSALTGIPPSTVRDWAKGKSLHASRNGAVCCSEETLSAIPSGEYAYLLGMYLGDGCLSLYPRDVWRLRIFMDSRYPGIIEECAFAISTVMPHNRLLRTVRSENHVELSIYSKHWLCFFPQHGPGRKHERSIELSPWQQKHVEAETRRFLRGLIHSDGCRVIADDRGRPSVRYHFSNRSEDIKRLFCDALDRLDVSWTRPSQRDIAIYRKSATEILDTFVGPKQ